MDDHPMAQAVDEILDPIVDREVRRARVVRLRARLFRLSALALGVLVFFGFSRAALPILAFFVVIGALCTLVPDADARPSARRNQTRKPGR